MIFNVIIVIIIIANDVVAITLIPFLNFTLIQIIDLFDSKLIP